MTSSRPMACEGGTRRVDVWQGMKSRAASPSCSDATPSVVVKISTAPRRRRRPSGRERLALCMMTDWPLHPSGGSAEPYHLRDGWMMASEPPPCPQVCPRAVDKDRRLILRRTNRVAVDRGHTAGGRQSDWLDVARGPTSASLPCSQAAEPSGCSSAASGDGHSEVGVSGARIGGTP
jgi:hypothetical protein